MKLAFHGATKQVTGSMYLLTLEDGYNILVECGIDYELQRHGMPLNFGFPFEPVEIDVVLLTHAHVDHSGNLPTLVSQGFRGQILCTPPTADLCQYLLADSANIQMSNYRQAMRHTRKSRRHLVPAPLYSQRQVEETMDRVVTVNFDQSFHIREGIEVTFKPVGHLLGAASIVIAVTEGDTTKTIAFTGDIGKTNSKLMPDPIPLPSVDYLVSESTYGGRTHQQEHSPEEALETQVQKNCVDIRGKLIIPAFSVGRTQAVLFTLHKLFREGRIPPVKIFMDSPLAIRTTPFYRKYIDLLDEEAQQFQQTHGDLFEYEYLTVVEDKDDEAMLAAYYEPHIIVSAAGMVEGGRIQEHIRHNIQNPFCTILIAGYCAEGTLGHRLLQGQASIRMKNRDFQVYATIASTDTFSSHADHQQLIDHLTPVCRQPGFKKLFLIHGEEDSMQQLRDGLQEKVATTVEIPERGEWFDL